jgi:hypothetical protein
MHFAGGKLATFHALLGLGYDNFIYLAQVE